MKLIKYKETEQFKKDKKKLLKRFKTLENDLRVVKKNTIELLHLHSIDNQSIKNVTFITREGISIHKIVKFACRTLKGRGAKSGIRIIYAWHVETFTVEFIEIYFKGDKENLDLNRISAYRQQAKVS